MKPIPYGKHNITEEDIKAVTDVLRSDFLTQGPHVPEFEKNFAHYCGAEYAVAVSNGTAALHLCALALDVKPGDVIITTPITFVATANGFRYCGAEIMFCDIDPDTKLLDIDKLQNILENDRTGRIKGVVPVDFAGYPTDMEKLRKVADNYGIWVVEDACHAPGAYFLNFKKEKNFSGNGKYADLSVFSFHPVKHIAAGEGGMITTNNQELFEKIVSLRTHGIMKDTAKLSENGGWYYQMHDLGYNYRLTDIQAALGNSQLKRLEENIRRRNEIAGEYNKAFEGNVDIHTPTILENIRHAFHLYIIGVPDRNNFYNYLHANKIMVQVHYIPVHQMPYYLKNGLNIGEFPVAEKYYQHCISLPIYPTIKDDEQKYIIEKVLNYY